MGPSEGSDIVDIANLEPPSITGAYARSPAIWRRDEAGGQR